MNIQRLQEAKQTLAMVLGGVVLVGGIGFAIVHHNHKVLEETRSTTQTYIQKGQQVEVMNFLHNQVTLLKTKKSDFDTLYSRLNSNSDMAPVFAIINPNVTLPSYNQNAMTIDKNGLEKISLATLNYTNFVQWSVLDKKNSSNVKLTDEQSSQYDQLYDFVQTPEKKAQLDDLFKQAQNKTNFGQIAAMDSLTQHLSDNEKASLTFLDNMKAQVQTKLAKKDYNFDASEQQFVKTHQEQIQAMTNDMDKGFKQGQQDIADAQKSSNSELDDSKSDLDNSEYDDLKSQINNDIQSANKDLNTEYQQSKKDLTDYNQYVAQDINSDKQNVQQLASNSQNSSHWGFFEYYLLYNWMFSGNSNSMMSNNGYQNAYAANTVRSGVTPVQNNTRMASSLYDVQSYNSGYKKMQTINLEKKPLAANGSPLANLNGSSKINTSKINLEKAPMPSMNFNKPRQFHPPNLSGIKNLSSSIKTRIQTKIQTVKSNIQSKIASKRAAAVSARAARASSSSRSSSRRK